MEARPERPEDSQTQSANSTYKEGRPAIHALENDAEADASDQRSDPRQRVIDAEAAAMTRSGRHRHDRPFGALGQSRYDPEREKQDPRRQGARGKREARGQHDVAEPSQPHRPRWPDPIRQ